MKHVFPFLLALFITGRLTAQEYKVTVENTKDGQLELDNFTGELPVEGYSGNEIIITSDEHFDAPERAKGLKPVYSAGPDNTGIALYMEKNGNKISFRCLLPITRSGTYHIKVPENLLLKIHRQCGTDTRTMIQNMKSEVDFDGCDEVNLKNVTGPLVISTINGSVNVVFSEISKDKPISIASINGEVDVTIPAKAGVNLEMSNHNGNMYSDFDMVQENKNLRRVGGNTVRATLNGGGTDLRLQSVNGNIYLRKG